MSFLEKNSAVSVSVSFRTFSLTFPFILQYQVYETKQKTKAFKHSIPSIRCGKVCEGFSPSHSPTSVSHTVGPRVGLGLIQDQPCSLPSSRSGREIGLSV